MTTKFESMGSMIEHPVCGVCGSPPGEGCQEVPCDPPPPGAVSFLPLSMVKGPDCGECGLPLAPHDPTNFACGHEPCPAFGVPVDATSSGVFPVFTRVNR